MFRSGATMTNVKRALLSFLILSLFTSSMFARQQSDPTNALSDFILARLAMEEGDMPRALALMDRVVASEPTNSILQYERVLMLVDASKLDRAEEELRTLVQAAPDFYDARKLLGRLLLDRAAGNREKLNEALVHLREAFNLSPHDTQSGMMIVQILVGTSRYAEADEVLAQLAERAPDNRAINYHYAQVLTKLGKTAQAREHLERVVAADPTFGPAVFQLMEAYQKENQWEKAANLLQPLIEEQPTSTELKRQQAFFYLRAGDGENARNRYEEVLAAEPADDRSRYLLAEALSDLGRFAEADAIYSKLLSAKSNELDVLISYGLSQINQQKYEEAAPLFRRVLDHPNLPNNLYAMAATQLASVEFQRGEMAAAAEWAQKALEKSERQNLQAVSVLLDVARKQRNYERALIVIDHALRNDGSNAYLLNRRVEFLLRSGEDAKAKPIADAEVKRGKREALGIAEAYASTGRHGEALAILEKQKQGDVDIDILFQIGSVNERAGKIDEAEKAFLDLLVKKPDHAPTLNYLGYMWADRGVNLDRAAKMLTDAVAQEPRNGAFVDSLGWVYFRLGKLELAQKYLTDASQLLPRDPTVQEHLGDLFMKMGDFDRALEIYRKALALDPDPKDEVKLKAKIADLEKRTASR